MGVCGAPFKCPPAPSEAALLLHDYLSLRGLRDSSEISLIMPFATPVPPSPDTSAALLEAFAEREIEFVADRKVASLDVARKVVVLEEGTEVPYDLFLGVPKHRAPHVVLESGMAENGYIPVDSRTLESRFPNVYAVGDVATVGVPKAGVFSERQARVVAEAIVARRTGDEPPARVRRTRILLHRVRRGPRRPRRRRLPLGAEADRRVHRAVGGARRREAGLRLDSPRSLVQGPEPPSVQANRPRLDRRDPQMCPAPRILGESCANLVLQPRFDHCTTLCSSASGPPRTMNPSSTSPSMNVACALQPLCSSVGVLDPLGPGAVGRHGTSPSATAREASAAEPLQRRPVLADGREDVQHDCAVRTGVYLVRDVGGDAPRAAGLEVACLVAVRNDTDPRSTIPSCSLSWRCSGTTHEGRARRLRAAALALDRPCDDTVPDPERLERGDVSERATRPEGLACARVSWRSGRAPAELP